MHSILRAPCEHLPTLYYPLYYAISDSFGDCCSFFFIFHFLFKGRKHNVHSYRTLIAHLSHTYRKLSARNGYHYAGFFLFYLFSPPFAHHFNTRVNTCRHTYYPIITPSYYTISYSFGHSCSFFFIFHFFIKGRKLQILALHKLSARNGYHI
jgi:hypothetical protein